MKTKSLKNKKSVLAAVLTNVPLIVFGIFCLLPFAALISGSLSANEYIVKSVTLWPRGFNLDAYRYVFMFPEDMINSYLLSIGVTAGGTVLNLALCLLIAYPLADPRYSARRATSFLLYFTILFNAGTIPIYIVIRRILGMYDTIWVLILFPLLAPSHVFFLRVFLQSAPQSLYESARIDGASEYRILFQIAIPIVSPAIATICFQFVLMFWNDSMTAMLFTKKTPVALYVLRWSLYIEFLKMNGIGAGAGSGVVSGQDIPELPVRLAMGVVTTIPMAVFFSFFQKYLVQGMTAGGVKE